jgi:hypothetical protein
MLKLGVRSVSILSFLGVLSAGSAFVGCGNLKFDTKYPAKPPKPTTVKTEPQSLTATKTAVPAGDPALRSFAASLTAVSFSVSSKTSLVNLSFSHLNTDQVLSDGVPTVTTVENLHGILNGEFSAQLEDAALAPAYSARVTCKDSVCAQPMIQITLKSGKLAGTAKVAVQSASALNLTVDVAGTVADGAEKAFEAQAKSAAPSVSGVGLYRIEGGKSLYVARTEIAGPAEGDKRILMISGSTGKNVEIQLGDLIKHKDGSNVPLSAKLMGDVDFTANPFHLHFKFQKSGLSEIAYFVPSVTEETAGSAGTQVKPKPAVTTTK